MTSMILSDLGGVVIRIDADRCHRGWAGLSGIPEWKVRRQLYADPVYYAFERDEVTVEEYLTHVRDVLEVDVADEVLARCFNDIYIGVDHNVLGLLCQQREHGRRVVALTNTNRLHYQRWWRLYRKSLATFQEIYLSFELDSRKPEPDCFLQVLDRERVKPQDVLFIDDVASHVAAARNMGIIAVQFTAPHQLEADLLQLLG